MLHTKLPKILRSNHGSSARFNGRIISYARQILTVQDELCNLCHLCDQFLECSLLDSLEEGDGIGCRIKLPPCTFSTAGNRLVRSQGTAVNMLLPLTLSGVVCIGLNLRDNTLQINIVEVLITYLLTGNQFLAAVFLCLLNDSLSVNINALTREHHSSYIIITRTDTRDGNIDVLLSGIGKDRRVGSQRPSLIVMTGIIAKSWYIVHITENGSTAHYAALDVVRLTHRIQLDIKGTARNPIVRIFYFCYHFL